MLVLKVSTQGFSSQVVHWPQSKIKYSLRREVGFPGGASAK